MITGVRGRLVSASFAEAQLQALPGAAAAPPSVVRALDVWSDRCESTLGPASSIRAISDVAVIPLLRILGFDIGRRIDRDARTVLEAAWSSSAVPVVVAPWNGSLDGAWRDVVLDGIRADARWCLCCNGAVLRIVDAHHTWNRHYLEFDLRLLSHADQARTLLWSVARAESMAGRPPLLDRAVELSARHGIAVCKALGTSVLNALALLLGALGAGRAAPEPQVLFDQSLTVLYRILFLLFAEARGLVPVWHPVYRERYTIDTIVSTLLAGRRYRGVWHAILAISRLAHTGCVAGALGDTVQRAALLTGAFSRLRPDPGR